MQNPSKRICKAVFSLLLITCSSTATIPSQANRGNSVSTSPCPDQRTYTGRYWNDKFSFSLVIPKGLKGYWNSGKCVPDEQYGCICMGDHGRMIPLSDDAYIEAYAGYVPEEKWSARRYEREEITSLKNEREVERIKVIRSKWMQLRNGKARRFIVQYTKKQKRLLVDHLIAVSGGVEYELILCTPKDRYQRNRQTFENVISSWRLTM